MKFRTEVAIKPSVQKIEIGDKVFSIGSCFATEIVGLLADGQLQVYNNPFGTLFNPYSIHNAVERLHGCRLYTEEDIVVYRRQYISLDHHTGFDTEYLHKTLEKINEEIERGNSYLQDTKWVVITYGTAFVYEFLPQKRWVANCHKLPNKFFVKRLLPHSELIKSMRGTVEKIRDIGRENIQILFSVSPVRHTKDGMEENMLSKSMLISALHEVVSQEDDCYYLPVYELMMDDLRDYRFYKEDMIHPSSQAVKYIFDKFGIAYFSPEVQAFIDENLKIKQALNHCPSNEHSESYKVFREKIEERIRLQQQKVKHKIFAK